MNVSFINEGIASGFICSSASPIGNLLNCLHVSLSNPAIGGLLHTGKAQRERLAEHSVLHPSSSDEGNACGFTDSKAQRERFAEYYDFSATNTTIRDEETGFGYFDARYYDSELLTGWLSVDPMSDKYPSLSPYAYCAWNPVKLVDPDGKEFDSISNIHIQRFEEFTNIQIYRLESKQQRSDEENIKLTEYKNAMAEVSLMRADMKTLYKVTTNALFSDQETDGFTRYGGKCDNKDVINISIQGDLSSRKGIIQISHELKHAFQFFNGEIIYAVDVTNNKLGMNNSRPLEIDAYNRSKAYGGSPMNPCDTYIQSLPSTRISLNQMQQKYPNCNYVYRKNK